MRFFDEDNLLSKMSEYDVNRHYSQAAPCAPGRAALYTGLYQSNNRVVGNGTPLDARFDNLALAGRRAGYRPEDCIVIEDSVTGVTAAHRAGCHVLGFTGTHPHPEEQAPKLIAAGARRTFAEMRELPQLVSERIL